MTSHRTFPELTVALVYKTQRPCCETPCTNCPYQPAYKGMSGPENWHPDITRLINNLTISTAPNTQFAQNTDAQDIIDAMKNGIATRSQINTYFVNR